MPLKRTYRHSVRWMQVVTNYYWTTAKLLLKYYFWVDERKVKMKKKKTSSSLLLNNLLLTSLVLRQNMAISWWIFFSTLDLLRVSLPEATTGGCCSGTLPHCTSGCKSVRDSEWERALIGRSFIRSGEDSAGGATFKSDDPPPPTPLSPPGKGHGISSCSATSFTWIAISIDIASLLTLLKYY